jgi:predicted TIM-barrel fold metal-dependent hydrolase
MAMIIIDSQVHIWGPETPTKPYFTENASKPHRPIPLGHEELLQVMDANGVQRTVCVPPTWEGFSNEESLVAARLYPDRFAVMGRLAIDKPESRELLPRWKNQPGMLGIRTAFHQGRAPVWLEDGTADWFWDAAERHDVPVMAFAPQAVPKLGEIAERHPGLRLIIDHMGLSSALRGKPLDDAVENLLRLARLKNVAVKVSALPCYVEEPYPFPTLHLLIRRVIDAFGPQRCFWGTDLSHLTSTYKQCLTLFTEELRFLSDNDKEWILGRGIAEWLHWPLPQQA